MVAYMYERVRTKWRMLLLAALVLLAAPRAVWAVDHWTAPYPGVRHLHRVGSGVDYHVVLINLGDPRVSLVATRPDDAFITTTEFARRYDAQIALNANFFNHGPCGLAVGDGRVMERAYEHNCRASIGFGRANEVAVFDSLSIPQGPVPAPWMTEVLSGKPFIMRDGRALNNWLNARHMYVPHPRSAIGVSADRRTLVILAADGRRRGAPGLTGFQMLGVFQEFGVADALNLDGGGSTALVVGGRLQNHPADGHENPVVSHIGIRIRSGLAWYRAEMLEHGAPAQLRQDETGTIWVEARNVGRTAWTPGANGASPVLELDDGVVSYTATVSEPTAPGAVGRFAIRWLARGAGVRHLRARLRSPDGDDLAPAPIAWDLEVQRAPHAAPPTPQHVVATAQSAEVVLPGGLGAVSVRTRACAADVHGSGRRSGVLASLGVLLVLAGARRRR